MSIVRCEECEQNIDIDYKEAHTNNGEFWICDECYQIIKEK